MAIILACLSISSALIIFPSQIVYAEYRCQAWGYTGNEARYQIFRLEEEYQTALENEQDPNYTPSSYFERSSQEIREEIDSIKSNCIADIKAYVRVNYLDREYPLVTASASSNTCAGQWPLTRTDASNNMQAIDSRVVRLASLQSELEIDGQTIGEMAGEERRLAGIFADCLDYLHTAGIQDDPVVQQPASDEPLFPPGTSSCIIATAAFGSNLAPQVQFLRDFRDNHILSTAAGSSFMNVFNTWYYSFSPSVADYERGQPWMQVAVRTAIQPLLAILQLSEKGYSSMPGEYGAMSAGLVASAMIGSVYFWPVALSIKQVRKSHMNYKIAAYVIAAASAALIVSILVGNQTALMITSALFVISIISISAILSARAINRVVKKAHDAIARRRL